MMPIKFKSDKKLLAFVSDNGEWLTHSKGYFWFWNTLMPLLKDAKSAQRYSNDLIADCYYVAGDVHDFNDAPLAAIKCYRAALKLDPQMGTVHREIANMLGRMGRYDEALAHNDKALALTPDDEYAISDRDMYIDDARLSPPLYLQGDPIWLGCEYLAQAKPKKALKAISTVDDVAALRIRAHCYGAMGLTRDYLAAWAEIGRRVKKLEFTYMDWFYMGDDVFLNPDFWTILLDSQAAFSGVFMVDNELEESERYKALSTHQKIRLKIKFFAAVHSGDAKGLKKLYKKYPEWVALRDAIGA